MCRSLYDEYHILFESNLDKNGRVFARLANHNRNRNGKDTPKMRKSILILAGIIAAALLFGACTVAPSPAEDTASAEAAAAADEPQAEATDAAEGNGGASFSLTTLTGDPIDQTIFSDHKLTMVNYWATWCGPCVSEIPDLVKISEDYADKGFALIGVHVDETDLDGVKKFMEEQKISYPIILPEGFFLEMIQGYQYIPTTLFFDSEGKQVGEAVVGSMSYDDWADLIDLLLEQVA